MNDGADSDGAVNVAVLSSSSQQAALLASELRRLHLLERIPYAEMAVVVKSTGADAEPIRQALQSAGIPTAADRNDLPLAQQPVVGWMLALLQVCLQPESLDAELVTQLLRSPFGGADALTLRRLRQQLRQQDGMQRPSSELLVEAVRWPDSLPEQVWAAPARRVGRLIAAGCRAVLAPAGVEEILWAIWDASGLASLWRARSNESSPRGLLADANLDAILALFAEAERFVDRRPDLPPSAFAEHVASQQLPADNLAASSHREAVTVVSAFSVKGRQWPVVAVAGLQEGRWPDLRPDGGVLGAGELVDVLAGRDPERLNRTARQLVEQRRLFYVACSRARRHLLLTAVSDETTRPSRLLDDLDPHPSVRPRPVTNAPPPLSLPSLVAQLRAELLKAEPDPSAAAILAELTAAEVPGADPQQWWGLPPISDPRPLVPDGEPVRVSPSKVERYQGCALRWFLETAGGDTRPSWQQEVGNLVHHVAAQAFSRGIEPADLLAATRDALAGLDLGAPWRRRNESEAVMDMIARLQQYWRDNGRQLVAAERAFRVGIGRAELTGRVDRLERDDQGRLVVVDLKTSKKPPREADLGAHAQLGAYQAAVTAGAFAEGNTSGGAILVQLRSVARGKVKQQVQRALDAEADPGWAAQLVAATAEGMAASEFAATRSEACDRCPVRSSCPAHDDGRMVTG